jgi:uncharacterized protein (DUF4415 family)
MNKPFTSSPSREQMIEHLKNLRDEDIDYSDIPEVTQDMWAKGKVRMPAAKEQIAIRLDEDVLAWFKAQGKGYQTRINAVLRTYVDAQAKKDVA